MKKWILIVLALLAMGAVVGGMMAHLQLSGAFSGVARTVEPGGRMPAFSLTDFAGADHALEHYLGQIVVLNFCSHKCPFSVGIDDDFAALVRAYEDNDQVVFFGIDSHYDTTADEIRAYAEANNLPQPILRDPDNAYADAVGALVTPDIYVIAADGILAYRGAFDNRVIPDRAGSRPYVADAIEALLDGNPVNPSRVASWGCTIKRADTDG